MASQARVLVALSLLLARAQVAEAQIPSQFENLQYFAKDIPQDALIQRMREFSFALGVRCQYCHAGGDGISFAGVSFSSDEKDAKVKARFMLRLVETLNTTTLASVPSRRNPPVKMDCVHCHRGSPVPTTLATELTRVIEEKGAAAAVTRYRELREDMVSGRFDFGEWAINELARTLREDGKPAAAIAMLELNAEYYPKSAAIDLSLGDLYRERGEREQAIRRYRRVLERDPQNLRAKRALEELERKKP
jgi:tetratricopeptide (TPR) repeat protein